MTVLLSPLLLGSGHARPGSSLSRLDCLDDAGDKETRPPAYLFDGSRRGRLEQEEARLVLRHERRA
jgi:hypothetical protein